MQCTARQLFYEDDGDPKDYVSRKLPDAAKAVGASMSNGFDDFELTLPSKIVLLVRVYWTREVKVIHVPPKQSVPHEKLVPIQLDFSAYDQKYGEHIQYGDKTGADRYFHDVERWLENHAGHFEKYAKYGEHIQDSVEDPKDYISRSLPDVPNAPGQRVMCTNPGDEFYKEIGVIAEIIGPIYWVQWNSRHSAQPYELDELELVRGVDEARHDRDWQRDTKGIYADYADGFSKPKFYCKCPNCGFVHGQYDSFKEAFEKRLCPLCAVKDVEKLQKEIPKSLEPAKRKPNRFRVNVESIVTARLNS